MVCTIQGENVLPTLSQVLPPLDESSAQPLYQQLQRALRGAIENRVIGPDDALPPERDLAEMLKVSRITVRKAIDELVEDGLLIRKQGSGTFVSNRVEKNFAKLTSFSEDMRARGREPRSVWMNRAAGTVTPEESLTLRSSPGTPVFRFHRIRYADDAPMAHRIRHGDRDLPALARVGGELAVRSTGTHRQSPGARPAAAARRAAHRRAGQTTQGPGARRRPAGGARGLSQGRPRRGVLAVLLPRRHLRLRRGAQRDHRECNPRGCSSRRPRAPSVVAAQLAQQCRAARRTRRTAARQRRRAPS